jgi:hypothetical protein
VPSFAGISGFVRYEACSFDAGNEELISIFPFGRS